jgi:hypothetical protein
MESKFDPNQKIIEVFIWSVERFDVEYDRSMPTFEDAVGFYTDNQARNSFQANSSMH